MSKKTNKSRSPNLIVVTANTKPPPIRRDPRNGKIQYFLFWTGEMKGRMAAMSPPARGAYISLLIEYMEHQGPLPDNIKQLCRITGISQKNWLDIRDELLDVFDPIDGHLVDDYAERSIAKFRAASKRGQKNIAQRYGVIDGLKDHDA